MLHQPDSAILYIYSQVGGNYFTTYLEQYFAIPYTMCESSPLESYFMYSSIAMLDYCVYITFCNDIGTSLLLTESLGRCSLFA